MTLPPGECVPCGHPTFRKAHAPWCWAGKPYPWPGLEAFGPGRVRCQACLTVLPPGTAHNPHCIRVPS